MSKAFIFDLDGVLIASEAAWQDGEQRIFDELLGADMHQKLGSTIGLSMDDIYDKAVAAGGQIAKDELLEAFQRVARDIYANAAIPGGAAELVDALLRLDYRIGIVSASPLSWITTVTQRLPFEDSIELIISLHERNDLQHKPAPDGYLEAMKALDAQPATTIILEDSNPGIQAAKTSGAYTIGLQQNLINGYVQEGADTYAKTMYEVIDLVQKRPS